MKGMLYDLKESFAYRHQWTLKVLSSTERVGALQKLNFHTKRFMNILLSIR